MFDSDLLFICILGTTLIFSWLFFYKELKARLFFLFFAVMYLVYSGIGGTFEGVSPEYIWYYFAFTLCINAGIYIALSKIRNNRKTFSKSWYHFFNYFLEHYSKKIIIAYLILCLVPLVYPEFKLLNIIKPPAPDAIAMLANRFGGEENASSVIVNCLSYIKSLLYPFYLFSLYKYGVHTFKLVLFVALPFYFEYCANAYLGRGSMLECILYIVAFTYFCRPKLAKPMLVSVCFAFPALIIFFVQYSMARIGAVASNISAGDAFMLLLGEESSYPQHFSHILEIDGKYISEYLLWLFTIPLPGFFRGGVDVHFAALFSEDMLGMVRSQSGFYILLPGVVGESVYLLGKYLFWLNGLLYGFIMGASYRLMTRYPQTLGLLIAAAVDFGYTTNRAGLFGGIPFILKLCVYFFIIIWLMKRQRNCKPNQVYNTNIQ